MNEGENIFVKDEIVVSQFKSDIITYQPNSLKSDTITSLEK